MPIVEFKVKGFQCERCGYQWVPLNINKEPRVCPKCKNPYWNLKRRRDLKPKSK